MYTCTCTCLYTCIGHVFLTSRQLLSVIHVHCTSCVTSQIAKRLQQTAHSLGDACVNLVYSSADVQMNPDDMAVKRELADQAKSVTEKVSECVCEGGREGVRESAISDLLSYWQVSYVVAAIQAGAVGTQACNEAIATIQSIVGDLETTAMFCTAGALNPEGKVGVFHEHRYVYGAMVLAANYTKKVVVVFINNFSVCVCVE